MSGVIGSSSVLVAKFSSAGAVQWQQTYGTGNEDLGNSVQQTSDGGYVVGGEVVIQNPDASRPGEALLLKLTSTGAIQFQDVFNANIGLDQSSDATSVKQTPDGGYILAGTDGFMQNTGPTTASWLAKTTATGALSWQHVFLPASDFSNFGSAGLTSDGGFVAAGTADVAFSDSIWLVKTDTNGNVPRRQLQQPTAGHDHRTGRRADRDDDQLPDRDAGHRGGGHRRFPRHGQPRDSVLRLTRPGKK